MKYRVIEYQKRHGGDNKFYIQYMHKYWPFWFYLRGGYGGDLVLKYYSKKEALRHISYLKDAEVIGIKKHSVVEWDDM